MGMIFCRGCGKEIHESAISCPHCGAPQSDVSADLGKKNGTARKPVWGKVLIVIFALFTFSIGKSVYQGYKEREAEVMAGKTLPTTPPAQISPTGDLAAMFNLMSSNTDLQRENKFKEIKGKIVEWTLPVYEISKDGNNYRVQTEPGYAVGTFVFITPRDDQDKAIIEGLKTGSRISFKRVISDVTMRHLEIKPAILFQPGSVKPALIEVQPPSVASQNTSRNPGLYEWKSGWGQGISEYSAEDGNGNMLYIACPDSEGAVSAIATIGGAQLSSEEEGFDVVIDDETHYNNPFQTDCRFCGNNFERLNNFERFWTALRKANNIRISASEKSAVIPTKNIGKILPAFSSKENSCRVALMK